jgi:hypothetical protein
MWAYPALGVLPNLVDSLEVKPPVADQPTAREKHIRFTVDFGLV